jgi:hypothetical protein
MNQQPRPAKGYPILLAIFGLNRAGQILYISLFVLAVPALTVWTVLLPRMKFHDEEERLFKAARHGDRSGVERSLAAGAKVNAAAPVDGKTALFRAAIFGYADVVRVLIEHGADPAAVGADGKTALDVAVAARAAEKDPAAAGALDAVVAALEKVQR